MKKVFRLLSKIPHAGIACRCLACRPQRRWRKLKREASQPMYVYCVCPHMLSLFETWNASKPICRAWLIVSNDDSCVRWNHFILSHRPPASIRWLATRSGTPASSAPPAFVACTQNSMPGTIRGIQLEIDYDNLYDDGQDDKHTRRFNEFKKKMQCFILLLGSGLISLFPARKWLAVIPSWVYPVHCRC